LFDHPHIEKYQFEDIPISRDLYLMDEKRMAEYDHAGIRTFTHAFMNFGFRFHGISSYAAWVVGAMTKSRAFSLRGLGSTICIFDRIPFLRR
jgi:hypothetical protein